MTMRIVLPIVFCICAVTLDAQISHATTSTYPEILARPVQAPTQRLKYGPSADQFGDLYIPQKPGRHPLIIMIHGGCWQESLPGLALMAPAADAMRAQGFAVWNIEYRRLAVSGSGYPDIFLDVGKAVDFARKIDTKFQIDLSHVTVVGHSAGGQLALWVAARSRLDSKSPLASTNPLHIDRVVTLAGIDDLKDYHDKGPSACGGPSTIDRLVGASERSGVDVYADTSPAALLPIMVQQSVVSGELDSIVPPEFGARYAAQVRAHGSSVEDVVIPGSSHFELIDPNSAVWPRLKAILSTE